MLIQIDPDDTELKESIYRAQKLKEIYEQMYKAWDRSQSGSFAYLNAYNNYVRARKAYESELINLALIFMERL